MPIWTKITRISALGILLLGSVVTQVAADAAFPARTCRPGYRQAGPRLCISRSIQVAAPFATAMRRCRNQFGRVATYGDLYYLYSNTNLDAEYNPLSRWIGPDLVSDDHALCGNKNITTDGDPDQENFEATCNKHVRRNYWCAHDDRK